MKISEKINPADIFRKIEVPQRFEAFESSPNRENIVPVKDHVLDQVQKSLFSDLKRVVTDLAQEMDHFRTIVQAIDKLQPPSSRSDAPQTSNLLATSNASEILTPGDEALLRTIFNVIPERSGMSQEHTVDNVVTGSAGSGTLRQLYDAVATKVKNFMGLSTGVPAESSGPTESTGSVQTSAGETIDIPVAVLSVTPDTIVQLMPGKVSIAPDQFTSQSLLEEINFSPTEVKSVVSDTSVFSDMPGWDSEYGKLAQGANPFIAQENDRTLLVQNPHLATMSLAGSDQINPAAFSNDSLSTNSESQGKAVPDLQVTPLPDKPFVKAGMMLLADQALNEPFGPANPRVSSLPISEELIVKDQTEKEIAKYGLRSASQIPATSPGVSGFHKAGDTTAWQTYSGVTAGPQSFNGGINKVNMGINEDLESSIGSQNPDILALLSSDDRVVSRVMRFVDDVNTLLETLQNDEGKAPTGTIQNQAADLPQIIKASTRIGEKKLGMNSPLRTFFADGVSFEIGKSVGLFIKDNGLLKLDLSSLVTSLSTHKENTLTNIRDFANNLSDRIDFLANPLIGAYVYNKTMLPTRVVTGDEKPSSLEQEFITEQNSLSERLKELKVLINQSMVVRDWFAHKKQNCAFDVEVMK